MISMIAAMEAAIVTTREARSDVKANQAWRMGFLIVFVNIMGKELLLVVVTDKEVEMGGEERKGREEGE
jgi:hypothetical protein